MPESEILSTQKLESKTSVQYLERMYDQRAVFHGSTDPNKIDLHENHITFSFAQSC